MAEPLHLPPLTVKSDGTGRRVGIEIEFADVDASAAAQLVRDIYGGRIEELDPHLFEVRDTRFGTFIAELDLGPAHGSHGKRKADDQGWLERGARALLGEVSKGVVPTEIVTPPMPIDRIGDIDDLVAGLRRLGAKGTDHSLTYGFGLHMNPEVAASDADYVLRHLQAYLLCSAWLRGRIEVDFTRQLLPFVNRFPQGYVRRVIDAAYAPNLGRLIDDYLDANPTRNRELDLLPLFAWLDEDRVRQRLTDELIKARPTFHYRLPNARLADPRWSVVSEWNLWVEVERLAHDRDRLAEMSRAYLANCRHLLPRDWREESKVWLEE